MSQAFIRESSSAPLVRASRESAQSTAEMYKIIEGRDYDFAVQESSRGYMVARLRKDGSFESWVEE